MASTRTQTFNISPTGEGRLDYSRNIQKTVETTVSSWQEPYSDNRQFTLGIGGIATFEILIPETYMILLYDIYLSCNPASDIFLQIEYLSPSIGYYPMFSKQSNQFIDVVFEKGFPYTTSYRVTAMNFGLAAIDCYYITHGMKTLRTELLSPEHYEVIIQDAFYIPLVLP